MKKLIYVILLVNLTACYKEEVIVPGTGLEDWSDATHSSEAIPDYDEVFPQDQVNRIDITIDESYWEIMQDDLEDLYGGSSGPGPVAFSDETPVMVPCTFTYNDKDWYHVGIRYKGNSSLATPYNNGIGKLPFRLDFNEFDNEYPEIWGQTFYGFEEMSLSSNYDDESLLREKIGADVFRDAGINAPQTAFYRVYVDHGDGPVYFGLYTNVEVVFDNMLLDQFGSESGNCYKPDGDAASFADGTFTTADFEKKTNEASDWSDVEALYNIINDDSRTTNPTQWRSDLEDVFDVDYFLKYLAVNTVIQNWDTYGNMTHNYYLYNDPADNTLKWIPWDNNEAFQDGKMTNMAIDLSNVGSDWPLINYIMSQSEYETIYQGHLQNVIDGAFEPSAMQAKYDYYHDLIEPYVTGSEGEISGYTFTSSSGFTNGLSELKIHVSDRYTVADSYLP